MTAIIFAVSIPVHLADLHGICAPGACVSGQLTAAEARALGDLGVSVDLYTAYVLALDLVVALGFCGIGAVIFWRKSREPGALFARMRPLKPGAKRSIWPSIRPVMSKVDPLGTWQ